MKHISFDCNGTPAQLWDLTAGATAVRLANSPYCLDAGDSKFQDHFVACSQALTSDFRSSGWYSHTDMGVLR
jgi:hypothetical protein